MVHMSKVFWWKVRWFLSSSVFRYVNIENMEKIFSECEKYGISGHQKINWYKKNKNNVSNIYIKFAKHERHPVSCFRCFVIFEVSEGEYIKTLMDLLPYRYFKQKSLRRHEVHGLLEHVIDFAVPFDLLSGSQEF
ncbi:hypothetical protein J2S53_001114 [Actinopolyspora lacussalsi]|nr:hypothetical protein [Actinopolyspora lacussalsi]